MFHLAIGLLLIASVQDVCGQKIVSFKSFVNNGSCTLPNTARENLDNIFFHAVLNLEHANIQDWWAFLLISPHEMFNETIAIARLEDCQPGAPPDYGQVRSDTSMCWKQGKDIHVLFSLGVDSKYNQSYFTGVWSKESSGSVHVGPPYTRLNTVAPNSEKLQVNGLGVSHYLSHLTFRAGQVVSLRYCVPGLQQHSMYLSFVERSETSTGDCVTLNTTVEQQDFNKTMRLGVVESTGMCRLAMHHTYVIIKEYLLLVTILWSASMFY